MSWKKTNATTPKDEKAERDYGRKPYYQGSKSEDIPHTQKMKGASDGGSYAAMMSRKNYAYSQQAQLQHSQFKKPYLADEFPEMEGFMDYTFDLLDFQPWDFTFDGTNEDIYTAGTPGGAGEGSCSVVCNINRYSYDWNDDCSSLVVYFRGDWEGPPTWEEAPLRRREPIGNGDNVYIEGSNHRNIERTGPMHVMYGPYASQTFTFNGIPSGQDIEAVFVQDTQAWCENLKYGHCKAKVTITNECAVCEEFLWDWTNSDEEISRSTSGTVYVVGGDSESYTWTLTQPNGSGWSISSTTTTVPNNTVTASSTACGSAIITVTSCSGVNEVTIEGSVREPTYSTPVNEATYKLDGTLKTYGPGYYNDSGSEYGGDCVTTGDWCGWQWDETNTYSWDFTLLYNGVEPSLGTWSPNTNWDFGVKRTTGSDSWVTTPGYVYVGQYRMYVFSDDVAIEWYGCQARHCNIGPVRCTDNFEPVPDISGLTLARTTAGTDRDFFFCEWEDVTLSADSGGYCGNLGVWDTFCSGDNEYYARQYRFLSLYNLAIYECP